MRNNDGSQYFRRTPLPGRGQEEDVASKGRIMVVDDDPIILKLTCARLEAAGYEVVTRSEAIGTGAAIKEVEPDVVLLDQNMPALTGEGLATVLRARGGEDVPIIFHSSEDLTRLQTIVQRG